MTKKTHDTKKGFTLLEVALYLAILSTLVFGIGSFVNAVSVSRVRSQTMTEVDQQALQILSIITETVRNAESVSTPSIGQEQNSLVVVDAGSNTVTFGLAAGGITINRGAGAIALSNESVLVDTLSFKNVSRVGTPSIIQVTLTLSYNNTADNEMYNYSKTYVATASLFN